VTVAATRVLSLPRTQSSHPRLNLGCGHRKLAGYLNVDHDPGCNPDAACNLEDTPWPIASGCAEEVVLSHVLEHLGRDTATYLAIIQELYRICAPNGRVLVIVPHPRHDDFLVDPTHVRAILPEQFLMFSKRKNREWIERGAANTTLALQLDVDFEIEHVNFTLDDAWLNRHLPEAELRHAATTYANVIRQVEVVLRAVKAG
jgi:hypothetical protein